MGKKSLLHIEQFLMLIITAVSYFLAASLGLELATINEQASPVWPAAGIAISLVYLYGNNLSLGVLIGAFLANWLLTDLAILPSLLVGVGNTLETLVAVYIFRNVLSKSQPFGSHSSLIFSLLSLFIASFLGSTIGTLVLFSFSIIPYEQIVASWMTWWVGDTLGALLIVPFAYKISLKEFNPFPLKKGETIKIIGLIGLALALSYFVFLSGAGSAFAFLFFIVIFLSSCWFESSWTYIFSMGICCVAIICTVMNRGPFVGNTLNENLIHLQLFLASLGFTAVGLGSLKRDGFLMRPRYALLGGWFLSGLAFYTFFNMSQEKDSSQFVFEVKKAESAVQNKMEEQIQILKAGARFFDASKLVTAEEWRRYTEGFLKDNESNGLFGVGVVFASPSTDPKDLLKVTGFEKLPENFRIRSVWNAPMSDRINDPESNFIITYLEPYQKNHEAIGLNIATEKNRYNAALRARDTGEAALSDQVQLVQDKEVRPGHLLIYPMYFDRKDGNGKPVLKGFIYAPFVASQFFNQAFAGLSNIHLNAYLGSEANEKRKIFESKGVTHSNLKSIVTKTTMAGQPVVFVWTPSSQFNSVSLTASWVGLMGALCTLFLALMISSLERLTMKAPNNYVEPSIKNET